MLIAYASHCGSTGGEAEAMGRVFCDSGASVHMLRVENAAELTPYRAVVIGAPFKATSGLPGLRILFPGTGMP